MNILDYDAYIFDLDGTLLQSMHMWDEIYIKVLKDFNIDNAGDYLQRVNHLSLKAGAEYTVNTFNIDISVSSLVELWTKLAADSYKNTIELKPYARELIEYLSSHGKIMGVATALSNELFEPCLVHQNIDKYFKAATSIDEVRRGKGFPDIYLKECEKLGADPQKTVVLEDSLKGIEGAAAGGFHTIGVWDKTSDSLKEQMKNTAERYIYSFKELLPCGEQ